MAPEKTPNRQPLLLSVHGIRTTGRWQKQLTEAAQDAGIRYRPLDFGYFMALSLLLPWARKRKIEWFHHECEDKLRDLAPGQRASIVAHSFGTYLLAGALTKYSDLRFDKIILCGSIVREDYPWSTIIIKRKQVNSVLNEAGGKDLWASLVCWVVSDAGPTGVVGFADLGGGHVTQRLHAEHRHSDYFYSGNYQKVWMPFLRGERVESVEPISKAGANWRFASTAAFLLVALGTMVYFGFTQDRGDAQDVTDDVSSTRQVASQEDDDPQMPPMPQGAVSSAIAGSTEPSAASTENQRSNPADSLEKEVPSPDNRPEMEATFMADQPDAGQDEPTPVEIGEGGFKPGFCEPAQGTYTAAYMVASLLIKQYPDMNIEIAGHADGLEEDPDSLSSCRAQRLYEYLRTRGLSAKQMTVKGYGNTRPISPNDSEEGRSLNRRVEVNAVN